jgi:hypothetical protein
MNFKIVKKQVLKDFQIYNVADDPPLEQYLKKVTETNELHKKQLREINQLLPDCFASSVGSSLNYYDLVEAKDENSTLGTSGSDDRLAKDIEEFKESNLDNEASVQISHDSHSSALSNQTSIDSGSNSPSNDDSGILRLVDLNAEIKALPLAEIPIVDEFNSLGLNLVRLNESSYSTNSEIGSSVGIIDLNISNVCEEEVISASFFSSKSSNALNNSTILKDPNYNLGINEIPVEIRLSEIDMDDSRLDYMPDDETDRLNYIPGDGEALDVKLWDDNTNEIYQHPYLQQFRYFCPNNSTLLCSTQNKEEIIPNSLHGALIDEYTLRVMIQKYRLNHELARSNVEKEYEIIKNHASSLNDSYLDWLQSKIQILQHELDAINWEIENCS